MNNVIDFVRITSGGSKNIPVVFPKLATNSPRESCDLDNILGFVVPVDEFSQNQ